MCYVYYNIKNPNNMFSCVCIYSANVFTFSTNHTSIFAHSPRAYHRNTSLATISRSPRKSSRRQRAAERAVIPCARSLTRRKLSQRRLSSKVFKEPHGSFLFCYSVCGVSLWEFRIQLL